MERKFKLIKEYPGSPQLNCIVIESQAIKIGDQFRSSYYYTKGVSISKDIVENYPEFWKEITGMDEKFISLLDLEELWNKGQWHSFTAIKEIFLKKLEQIKTN